MAYVPTLIFVCRNVSCPAVDDASAEIPETEHDDLFPPECPRCGRAMAQLAPEAG